MPSRTPVHQVTLLYGNQQYPLDRRAQQITDSVLGEEDQDFTYHRFDAADLLRPAAAEAVSSRLDALQIACESMPLLGNRYLVRIDHVERVKLPARAVLSLTRRLGELAVRQMTWDDTTVWVLEEQILPGDEPGGRLPLQNWVSAVTIRSGGGATIALAEDADEAQFLVSSRGSRHVMGLKPFLRTVLKGNFTFAGDEADATGQPAPSNAAVRLHGLLERNIERPQPECRLLLTAAAVRESDISKPLLKLIKKHGEIEKFVTYDDYEPVDWVLSEARERSLALSREGAEILIHYVGNDLGRLAQELEKLSLFFPPGARPQTSALLEALHAAHTGSVFLINDKLSERDLAGALEVVGQFLAVNANEYPVLVGVLARHFRQLYTVHSLSQRGVSDSDLASRLKVHPFIAKKISLQAARFTPNELEHIIQHLAGKDRSTRFHAHLAPVILRDFVQAVCAGAFRHGKMALPLR